LIQPLYTFFCQLRWKQRQISYFTQEWAHKWCPQSPRAEVTSANVFCTIPGSVPYEGKELNKCSKWCQWLKSQLASQLIYFLAVILSIHLYKISSILGLSVFSQRILNTYHREEFQPHTKRGQSVIWRVFQIYLGSEVLGGSF
jgi:hypothetical protein